MFKVSFKDNFKKIERFNDRATVVTLTGKMKMPEWLHLIPFSITDWACMYSGQDVDMDFSRDVMTVIVKGKAVRAEGDADNPILAERIAESRAKIKLYRFMLNLCSKISDYYRSLLIGKESVIYRCKVGKGSLVETMQKYDNLLNTEQEHLDKLLLEA